MRRALVAVATLLALLVAPLPASACTCGGGDPRDVLHDSSGAFIGRYLETVEESSDEVVYRYEVDVAIKGELGETIDIRSNEPSTGSCGLYPTEGQVGLFLGGEPGAWHSSMCSIIGPERLRAAAEDLEPVRPGGRATMLVGGSFGAARVAALDEKGEVVGYGFGGDRTVTDLDVCPDSRRAVELAEGTVAVRRLSDLSIVSEYELPEDALNTPTQVFCERRGRLYFSSLYVGSESPGRIYQLEGDEWRLIYEGKAMHATIGGRTAFLNESYGPTGAYGSHVPGRIFSLDLETGTKRHLADAPEHTGPLELSPDGRHLGAIAADPNDYERGAPRFMVAVEVGSGRVRTKRVGFISRLAGGWWGNHRYVNFCHARIYNLRSDTVHRADHAGPCQQDSHIIGKAIWSVETPYGSWHGYVTRKPLSDRSERRVAVMPSPLMHVIEPIPGGVDMVDPRGSDA